MVKNPLINETLLQMKFARVVSLLAKTLRISEVHALDLFYTSEVYRCLSNLEYHLHNRSDAYIVDVVVKRASEVSVLSTDGVHDPDLESRDY